MTENDFLRMVFETALKVHQEFNLGLLESAYEECLFINSKNMSRFK